MTIPRDDDGSVLLLTLGYALLALALILVCACATDLALTQKRIDAVADAAALAGADGFILAIDGEEVRAQLTDAGVREQAEVVLAAMADDAVLVSATAPEGVSARVTVTVEWHPPAGSIFVPDGVRLEATGTSRTALR